MYMSLLYSIYGNPGGSLLRRPYRARDRTQIGIRPTFVLVILSYWHRLITFLIDRIPRYRAHWFCGALLLPRKITAG